jgi:hypothetical protein
VDDMLISEVVATLVLLKGVIYFPDIFSFNAQKCNLEIGTLTNTQSNLSLAY